MIRFLLNKLGFLTKNGESENEPKMLVLWALEELMFWSGFFALMAGSGWASLVGGIFVLGSIVFAFVLLH